MSWTGGIEAGPGAGSELPGPAMLLAQAVADLGIAACYVLLLFLVVQLNRQKHLTIYVPRRSYRIAFAAILLPGLAASAVALAAPGAAVQLAYKSFVLTMLVAMALGIWRILPRKAGQEEGRRMRAATPALEAAEAGRREALAELGQLRATLEERVRSRTAELTAANMALEKDIIARRLDADRAAETMCRLDELMLRANAATVVLDADMIVLEGSPGLARLVGRGSAGEIVGRELGRLLGIRDDGALGHFRDETLRLGTCLSEFEGMPPARGTVAVEASGVATSVDGRPCVMALLRDVTERRQAENALVQSREAMAAALEVARQANATKSIFLAKMNHELRTPLNGIIGLSEILRHKSQTKVIQGTEVRKICDNIHQSGSHLLSLVDDLLDLSRLDAGSRSFRPTEVGVRAEVDAALATLGSIADQKHITVENACPAAFDWFLDQRAFKQIVINLVNNAVKFSPRDSRIRISVTPGADSMALHISDQGPGISEDERERILTPYGRGSYAETNGIDGVGLGLTIVSELLKLQGGHLAIESQSGCGATFTAVFPMGAGREPALRLAAE